jgi:ABC-type antimicrobial peptide transport system permease subunit
MAENIAAPRFNTLLFGTFAGLAVCLAMVGVYGVMAYVVGQRASEIGLRMALGASSGRVMMLVLRQGLTLAAIGLVLGLAGAAAATRLLSNMLYSVKPADPATYVAVTLLLGLVALAATWIPARRAMRLDPLTALRQE